MVYGWIWLAVLVASLIGEALTKKFYLIWFVPSSVVALALDICDLNIAWQVAAFALIFALGFTFKQLILPKIKPSISAIATGNSIESLIGEKCTVTETIDNFSSCGQARVRGQVWAARSVSDDEIYEEGTVLRIVAIEGVKLICRK